jgi:hypothetical protein
VWYTHRLWSTGVNKGLSGEIECPDIEALWDPVSSLATGNEKLVAGLIIKVLPFKAQLHLLWSWRLIWGPLAYVTWKK